MKKVIVTFSAVILIAGLTFAQTPQSKDKAASKPAEKKEMVKDHKAGCDEKTKAACGEAKKSGCCSHGAKKPAPATTPEKK